MLAVFVKLNFVTKQHLMKKHLFTLIFALGFSSAFAQDKNNHVILVSIDGLRPEFYLDPSWAMVNLRQLMAKGSYAEGVRGSFPTVTYPSHTTMVTGKLPAKHGIHYNTPVEPLGISGKWFWYYKDIKVPTIFSVAKDAGMTTSGVSWPVTVGAPISYNLPEYVYLPKNKEEKRDEIKAMADESNPKELINEVQEFATGKFSEHGATLGYFDSDQNKARMAAYIIKKYKPNFLALHIATVDHFEHEQGRDGDIVRQAVQGADVALKTVIDAVEKAGIKGNTTIIVTGDHGFVDIHSQFNPNVLLAQAGLYPVAQKENWKAYFQASGGSTFLHLKDPKDTKTLAKVQQLLDELPEKYKKLFRVVDKEELTKIQGDPTVPMALAAKQGIAFGAAAEGDLLKAAKGGTHGYMPTDFKEIQTGFVAAGKGIKKDTVLPLMGQEDIAPLIAHLLGLKMETDGILYPGLLAK